jgi:biotin carboxyl carrier protein
MKLTPKEYLEIMEEMKMQLRMYSPGTGRVKEKLVKVGEKVEAKDLLLVIE